MESDPDFAERTLVETAFPLGQRGTSSESSDDAPAERSPRRWET